MNKPVVVLGAGGHASVLVESLKQQNRQILALIAPQCCGSRLVFDGIPVWKDDTPLLAFSPENIELVNGIGSLPGSSLRATLFSHYRQAGYRFMTVISARAYVSEYAVLAEGVQVMAGAIIQTGAQVGDNTIINSGAIVEHDCSIGAHCHIAPGAVLSGSVKMANNVHVGTGASVIQSIVIGDSAVIGAGATVTSPIAAEQTQYVAKGTLSTNRCKGK
ncbi:acetyltransferase [Plesiomonas shigelloides]|uniref:acetyltransferase n=1 Tax=Plesiomonas shigelloides TaxID=703 RepID=UPI0012624905|nr:acetyltransferase [Plesiomonas shigelloides]KAB7660850.1 shikimate dehydrogenase [Plesiomonas shigelloides]